MPIEEEKSPPGKGAAEQRSFESLFRWTDPQPSLRREAVEAAFLSDDR
jgi:hypothetical protein